MEHPGFLKYFINEEIYLLNDQYAQPEQAKVEDNQYLVVVPVTPLSEADQEFLYKIFAAVNVAPEILKISKDHYNLEDHPLAFFFGTRHEHNPVNLYEATAEDSCTLVQAHSLAELAEDSDKKRLLWNVLKSCFD